MTCFDKTVILVDAVLAIVINTSAMLLNGASIDFVSWYPGACCAFTTNIILQLILPVPAVGRVVSRPLEAKPIRPILSVFVENLIYVTFISFTMAVIQHGSAPLIAAWLATYGYLVLIGYVTSLILFAIANRRAGNKTGVEAP